MPAGEPDQTIRRLASIDIEVVILRGPGTLALKQEQPDSSGN